MQICKTCGREEPIPGARPDSLCNNAAPVCLRRQALQTPEAKHPPPEPPPPKALKPPPAHQAHAPKPEAAAPRSRAMPAAEPAIDPPGQPAIESPAQPAAAPPVLSVTKVPAYVAPPPPSPEEQLAQTAALIDMVRAGKHFVFMFGGPGTGKTTVVASMLEGMQRPGAEGRLTVLEREPGARPGFLLWREIRDKISKSEFPGLTKHIGTTQLHARYSPNNGDPPVDIVFLETGGEALRYVSVVQNEGRQLPFHIDVFLSVPNIKLVFLATAPSDRAAESDPVVESFIDYLDERAPRLTGSRFILLVTKWDKKVGNLTESVDAFVKREMPHTYSKLVGKPKPIQSFSVGEVARQPGNEDKIIATFDPLPGRHLLTQLLKVFTGANHWWQNLRGKSA